MKHSLPPGSPGFARCCSGRQENGEEGRKRAKKGGKGTVLGRHSRQSLNPYLLHPHSQQTKFVMRQRGREAVAVQRVSLESLFFFSTPLKIALKTLENFRIHSELLAVHVAFLDDSSSTRRRLCSFSEHPHKLLLHNLRFSYVIPCKILLPPSRFHQNFDDK